MAGPVERPVRLWPERGEPVQYKYGNKKQWRRWVWNRLKERSREQQGGLVLFLAGENAHDIDEAKRRGFRAANMLAVENDEETLLKLRAANVLTIKGDLCDVLLYWPRNRSVAVVLADFCCGLELRVLQTMFAAQVNPSFADTAFAVNMLRGRDASTNFLRKRLTAFEAEDHKHRGAHLFSAMALDAVTGDLDADDASQAIQEQIDARGQALYHLARPALYSYQSTAGTQVFDCVVWKNHFGALARRSADLANLLRRTSVPAANTGGLDQKRRTAAVLAHHTMRTT